METVEVVDVVVATVVEVVVGAAEVVVAFVVDAVVLAVVLDTVVVVVAVQAYWGHGVVKHCLGSGVQISSSLHGFSAQGSLHTRSPHEETQPHASGAGASYLQLGGGAAQVRSGQVPQQEAGSSARGLGTHFSPSLQHMALVSSLKRGQDSNSHWHTRSPQLTGQPHSSYLTFW